MPWYEVQRWLVMGRGSLPTWQAADRCQGRAEALARMKELKGRNPEHSYRVVRLETEDSDADS